MSGLLGMDRVAEALLVKVVWITPKSDLIEAPSGLDSRVASVRYRAITPAAGLAARGHQAAVVGFDRMAPVPLRSAIDNADIVVFRRNYEEPQDIEALLEEYVRRGKKTAFDLSDDRLHGRVGPHLRRMIALAGTIVTTSATLQQKIKQESGKDAFVIGDPFEGPRGVPRWSGGGGRLKALWFGHPVNLPSLYQALPALLQAGKKRAVDLRIVTERVEGIERECKEFNARHRNTLSLRFAEWSNAETWGSLEAADFVVIPAVPDHPRSLAKSPNRIIESLWAGRFVLAHPIPSYMEFNDWAWIGRDLVEGMGWMMDNGALIEARIRSAQEHIARTYSPGVITSEWEKVLGQI